MPSTAIVWSKDNCPWCVRAKDVLTRYGIQIEERKIGANWTKEQLLESVPNARTVPQIFLNGDHIGGHDDLLTYIENHNMYTNEEI